ncbi:MAG: DUF4037 domain-containing protein [Geodermatophilaceae bacterium]|nr:DUF4037 domain-containing protein [Geodermatophilaceae bacterium]
MSGQELSRRFHAEVVGPVVRGGLGEIPYAAAMLGDGSDVLGYDDDISPDHDFGPKVQLVLPPGVDPEPLLAVLAQLPTRYEGYPVLYGSTSSSNGWSQGQPAVSTPEELFRARLGFDPAAGIDLADWLTTPTQILATLTSGPVFHDQAGLLTERREALRWYPDDVWRYVLAAAWLRIDQEEPFVGRTGGSGDELGSRIITARIARDQMKLAFLIDRRWAPYSKWLGRGFADLRLAPLLTPLLQAALSADLWREREANLCAASSVLAEATNDLQLAEPVDPAPRQFFDRDIRVLDAARLVVALTAVISDPQVRRLVDSLGGRLDGTHRLPGNVDQAVDSVDVLTNHALRRDAGPTLGLSG